jgi:hypothetical protein
MSPRAAEGKVFICNTPANRTKNNAFFFIFIPLREFSKLLIKQIISTESNIERIYFAEGIS